MTAVVVAPRVESPTSDTEAVTPTGWFTIRPSKAYVAGGQWVQPVWSAQQNFAGAAVTVQLDPLTDVPYELYVNIPNGKRGRLEFTEFRIVPASGTPVAWETLVQVTGPGGGAVLTDVVDARLDALESGLGGVSGGASTLAGVSGISTDAKTMIATPNTYAQMLALLLGAPLASPALTGNPTAPTPTAGDNDTSIATTAFVDASFAKKASPTFTGTPAAPTAAGGTSTTQIATTAFVQAAVTGGAVSFNNPTFTGTVTVPDGALALADVNGLVTALSTLTTAAATAQTTADAATTTAEVGEVLSNALAGYVTIAGLNAILANVPYFLPYNGSAWPGARPSDAGTRILVALGGPAAPTWLNTTYKDFWVGTPA